MKTVLEALQEHRRNFWRAANCDHWMAAELQLIAYNARQQGKANAATRNTDNDARYYLGVTDQDQFYA